MTSDTSLMLLPVVRDKSLTPRQRRPILAIVLHTARLAILVGILLLLRKQHQSYLAAEASRDQKPVTVKVLQGVLSQCCRRRTV